MSDLPPPLVLSGRHHEGRPTYGPMQVRHVPARWMVRAWTGRSGSGRWYLPGAAPLYLPGAAVEALPSEGWQPDKVWLLVDRCDAERWGDMRWIAASPTHGAEGIAAACRAALAAAPVLQPEPEPEECTGVAARWCPIHGDCTCPAISIDPGDRAHESLNCPLHDMWSGHGEPEPELAAGDDELMERLRSLVSTYDKTLNDIKWLAQGGTNASPPGEAQSLLRDIYDIVCGLSPDATVYLSTDKDNDDA